MTVIERWAVPVRRLEWQLAKVRKIVVETYRVKSLILHVTSWQGHLPGQHVDMRLTAEDGYQAQRRDGRPSMSDGRRIWHCTPNGHAPSPRPAGRSRSCFTAVLIQKSGRRHLSRRTRCNGAPRS